MLVLRRGRGQSIAIGENAEIVNNASAFTKLSNSNPRSLVTTISTLSDDCRFWRQIVVQLMLDQSE